MRPTRRELRGLALMARGGQILRVSDSRFIVKSQSGSEPYVVGWHKGLWACDCADFLKGHSCKHIESIHWALVLPHVLLANAGVAAGLDINQVGDSQPLISKDGRIISVHKAVTTYKLVLACISDINPLPALPRPRLTRPDGRKQQTGRPEL